MSTINIYTFLRKHMYKINDMKMRHVRNDKRRQDK